MLELNGKRYYKHGINVRQYRLILRYLQAMEEGEQSLVGRLKHLLKLLPELYNNRFTTEELTELFEEGKLGTPEAFILTAEEEVKSRLQEVGEIYKDFHYIYPQVSDPYKAEDKQEEGEEAYQVRKMVVRWYQSYIFENQILSFNELDGMLLEDLVDINQTLTVPVIVKQVEQEVIDDLNTRFKAKHTHKQAQEEVTEGGEQE